MKPMTRNVLAALAAWTLLPGSAGAQSQDTQSQGYLVDSRGNVVMSGSGLCWRHRDPDQPLVYSPCEPVSAPVAEAAPPPPPAAALPPPSPAVIAAAPAAPPAPRAQSAPLAQKISFSGEALFAFDKSVLKPEGRVLLDELARKLEGASLESIVATGHTDRFGSESYNQKLSERRASAVKDYLVGKNLQAGRIDAAGKGETQPVTKAGDCRGAKSVKVVACLQPDRRVDVEMKGTQTMTSSR